MPQSDSHVTMKVPDRLSPSGGACWSANSGCIEENGSEHEIISYLGGDRMSMPLPSTQSAGHVRSLSRSLPDIRDSAKYSDLFAEPALPLARPPVSNPKVSSSKALFPAGWLPGARHRPRPKLAQVPAYCIEYSVFRPVAHLRRIENKTDLHMHLLEVLENEGFNIAGGEWPANNIAACQFAAMVSVIVRDVENDPQLKPARISQGSSGSYFILGKRLAGAKSSIYSPHETYKKGIFKPKDEEPYGPLSPKWSKWLHRTFFPCFFGRSCLIPNLGYISEAAACVLDRELMSFIVPYTDIIHLKSESFYYSFWDRTRNRTAYKIGSFQCFLDGYTEANVFLKQHPFPQRLDDVPDGTSQLCHENDARTPQFFWSKALISQFQDELEKLVILDYVMRNTDRGLDNWMIKVEWVDSGLDGVSRRKTARLKLGAIDSGLAFPWKHPDEWRSFPFGWLFLPCYIIGRPFSRKARSHFLPLLTSRYWWEQTTVKLKAVFQKDADFKERMWHKQIAVLKGQAFNVVEVLKLRHAGPLELMRRENLLIWDDTMNVPAVVPNTTLHDAIESSIYDASRETSRQFSETTPLLTHASGAANQNQNQNQNMSGFDYNMTFEDRESVLGHGGETNTKTVIIERLEKVHSKRPVFTWC